MLGQMVNCLHWGPDFILTMTPVSKLNAYFLNHAVYISGYVIRRDRESDA